MILTMSVQTITAEASMQPNIILPSINAIHTRSCGCLLVAQSSYKPYVLHGPAHISVESEGCAFSAPYSSADSGAVDSLDSHTSGFSNSAVPLLLLGTAGGAPVNPVGMTPQELAKRCGLVFQFPERYFLGGTLQDVSAWSGSCCLLACYS